jgi:hypothetical protein
LIKSGDYRGAWDVQSRIISLESDLGRANSSDYFALVNVGCTVLRNGGKPRKAVDLVESAMANAKRAAPDVDIPGYLEGSRAMARIQMGKSDDAVASLLRETETARQSGAHYWVLFQAALATAAIDQADLATAEARWTPLAPIEQKALADKQRGIEIVGLLVLHARLEMMHQRMAGASRLLDQAEALIASRGQSINPDAREVELRRAEVLLAGHMGEPASRHAQAAVEIARRSAVDPQSSAWIGEALFWRARAEAALGRQAAAATTAREALPHLLQNLDPDQPIIAMARTLAAGDDTPTGTDTATRRI